MGVTSDGTIAADDAVAWDGGRVWVLVEGVTDGAGGVGAADLVSDPGVGSHLASRDLESCPQD